jgi:peptidoglycan/xylan/chitin deacetylase (PgdA/CDA1 family)
MKELASAADLLRSPRSGIVFLLYHRVGRRSAVSVDLPLWLFEEQIDRITPSPGVVGIASALGLLRDAPSTDEPPVVVTFDDGTADFVEVALPVLVRYRVPATLYVATEFVDSGRDFPDAGRPASWSALRDAVSTGLVTIGSHTHSHLLLDRSDPKRAASDIARSVGLIEEHLGQTPEHFAYPKALLGSPAVESIVRDTFRSAALAGTRTNLLGAADRYRLNRTPVQVQDGLRYFDGKVGGGMRLEDDIRRAVNRLRQAGLTY